VPNHSRCTAFIAALCFIASLFFIAGLGFIARPAHAQQPPQPKPEPDLIAPMVAQLTLERYKATIKGLTQFGDRRQGTDRNRSATDWIEAQLKSYGCANTERIHYTYDPPPAATGGRGGPGRGPADPNAGPGGARRRGYRIPDTVNTDPLKQPDLKIRELDTQPMTPGPREEVYCTKIGTTHPDEMYIVSAHMDGHGWNEAADDDGSGTALVMELARIFSSPRITTERSVRFILWNNEETGSNGARAYVEQRKALQGVESPEGSGRYAEPKWIGMIQHDMLMFDHGMPLPDGTIPPKQRPEADINIEYQVNAKLAEPAMLLAQQLLLSNDKYSTDYPATLGLHMTNTDSGPFMDFTPSVTVREAERGAQLGQGWNPHHHQPTDVYSTYDDNDFRLGLNAAQMTLGAVARLTGAKGSLSK
jgi:Peptidase family M28